MSGTIQLVYTSSTTKRATWQLPSAFSVSVSDLSSIARPSRRAAGGPAGATRRQISTDELVDRTNKTSVISVDSLHEPP